VLVVVVVMVAVVVVMVVMVVVVFSCLQHAERGGGEKTRGESEWGRSKSVGINYTRCRHAVLG
jgi:heme/copper-type cytochrome/quinol oxidase subunit 2